MNCGGWGVRASREIFAAIGGQNLAIRERTPAAWAVSPAPAQWW